MKTGKLSENILKRSVLRQIKQHRKEVLKGAGVGGDCALLALQSDREERMPKKCAGADKETAAGITPKETAAEEREVIAISTETVVLPVKNAAYLAVMAAANNIAAGGGRPVSVVLSVTLPKEAEELKLKELMAEAERCCKEMQLQIAGGHTEVSGNVSCPVITATAIGTAKEKGLSGRLTERKNVLRQNTESVLKTQNPDIVMSKWIGLEGTCILAGEKEQELLERYPASLVNGAKEQKRYLSVAQEAEIALKQGVYAMHDIRYGGVFGALWELSQKTGMGFCVELKKIPVKQETVEVCEFFGVNPYELLSGGALLMVTEDGAGLVSALAEAGISAAVIGSAVPGNDKIVINGEEARCLGRPQQDEIFKVYS